MLCFDGVRIFREETCRIVVRFIECYSEEEIKFDRHDEPQRKGGTPLPPMKALACVGLIMRSHSNLRVVVALLLSRRMK